MLGLPVLEQGHFRLLAHQPSRHAPDLLLRISTSATSPQSGKPCANVALGDIASRPMWSFLPAPIMPPRPLLK